MSQENSLIEDVKSKGEHTKLFGDRLNCAVTALSSAFDIPYDQADSFAVKEWKRKRRHRTKTSAIVQTLSTGSVFGKRVKSVSCFNAYKTPGKLIKCRSKLYTFLEKHKEGTYYVMVRGHCTVIKNGKVLDNTKPGMTVESAYKITREA